MLNNKALKDGLIIEIKNRATANNINLTEEQLSNIVVNLLTLDDLSGLIWQTIIDITGH